MGASERARAGAGDHHRPAGCIDGRPDESGNGLPAPRTRLPLWADGRWRQPAMGRPWTAWSRRRGDHRRGFEKPGFRCLLRW